MKDVLVVLRRVVHMHEAGEGNHARAKIKVPKPKKFEGVQSAKQLENFIWDKKRYFKAAKILEV